MLLSTAANTDRSEFRPSVESSTQEQTRRIMMALGASSGVPRVSEETLARYHEHLAANLSLPFVAYYPEPMNPREKAAFRRVVVELLDPSCHAGDEIDGIYCRTRQGEFEVNLPLIELHLPEGNRNAQLIEDYWYWMWNWR